MTGKREALRFYEGNTQPRKRWKKEEGDSLVHLNYQDDIRVDNLRMHEIVEFINRTMKREFNLSIGRDGAIVNYHTDKDGKGWILKAASTDLAKKVCCLHGIYYKYQQLNIQKYGVLSSPASWCWNDYCLKRYGKNAHFVDHHVLATVLKSAGGFGIDCLKLQSKLNEKMEEFKLASTNAITKTVKVKSEGENDKFLLCLRAERYATRLTYLNYISIDNLFVTLERLPEWKGEEPRYKHYHEFLKDHNWEEAKRAHKKQVRVQSMDRPNMEMHPRGTGCVVTEVSKSIVNSMPSEGGCIPITDSEEENQEDKPGLTVFEEYSSCTSSTGKENEGVVVEEQKPAAPTSNVQTAAGNSAKTSTQDDHAVQELNSKPGAVQKGTSVIISIKDDEEPQQTTAANARMKAIITEQAANAKALRALLKIANGKLADKDDRIGQLEKIVQKQQKDTEDERRKVSSKEVEVGTLRENLANQKKGMEEQCRILTAKEEETARLHRNVADLSKELESALMKLDAVHQSWGSQVLMLEAKDKQIAVLEAKLEKVTDAILWRPDTHVKENEVAATGVEEGSN